MEEVLHHLGCFFGLVNDGINYLSGAEFLPSTVSLQSLSLPGRNRQKPSGETAKPMKRRQCLCHFVEEFTASPKTHRKGGKIKNARRRARAGLSWGLSSWHCLQSLFMQLRVLWRWMRQSNVKSTYLWCQMPKVSKTVQRYQ